MPMATPDERTRDYKLSFVPVQSLLDAGQFPDALAELERVTAGNPDCAQAHNDLAVLYHACGRLPDADRESRRALELDPFHADIRDNRNAIVAALGSVAPPAPPAPKPTALENAPAYRDALRRAEELMAAGQLEAAVAEIERFVERAPATAEAWNDLGVLHRDGGRLPAAHAALTVALTIEPTNLQAAHNLTRVLLEMGRHHEALRTLEPVLTRDPRDVEALTLAGDISLALRQNGDAGAFFRAALAIDPSNVDLAVRLTNVAAAAPTMPAAAPAPALSIAASGPAPAPALALMFFPAAAPTSTSAPASTSSTSSTSSISSAPPWVATYATTAIAETTRVLDYDPRVRLVTADETYDAVTCKIPLDRLPNPIAALTEMTRVLRPGGKLWIDLGGPLEVIKHIAPRVSIDGRADNVGNGSGIGSPLPTARAR